MDVLLFPDPGSKYSMWLAKGAFRQVVWHWQLSLTFTQLYYTLMPNY